MRKLLVVVVGVALMGAMWPGVALAGCIEEGEYFLYVPGEEDWAVKIEEHVYGPEETFEQTGIADAYLYQYNVNNDSVLTNPGVWCWGFMEHPSTWGATVLAWYSPPGWGAPHDCACLSGVQAGWSGTAAPNGDGNAWHDYVPPLQAFDGFWLVARQGPYRMADAFAHDGSPMGQCNQNNRYAYGQISAPTPEPVTLGLLALGLPLGLLARRRKED